MVFLGGCLDMGMVQDSDIRVFPRVDAGKVLSRQSQEVENE